MPQFVLMMMNYEDEDDEYDYVVQVTAASKVTN